MQISNVRLQLSVCAKEAGVSSAVELCVELPSHACSQGLFQRPIKTQGASEFGWIMFGSLVGSEFLCCLESLCAPCTSIEIDHRTGEGAHLFMERDDVPS